MSISRTLCLEKEDRRCLPMQVRRIIIPSSVADTIFALLLISTYIPLIVAHSKDLRREE